MADAATFAFPGKAEIAIPEGRFVFWNRVALQDGRNFTVSLANLTHRRADVELVMEGKPAGVFRVEPHSSILLERPLDRDKKFCFRHIKSPKGKALGLEEGTKSGRIRATFKFERERQQILGGASLGMGVALPRSGAGSITLRNKSGQTFEEMEEIQYSNEEPLRFHLQLINDYQIPSIEILEKRRKLWRRVIWIILFFSLVVLWCTAVLLIQLPERWKYQPPENVAPKPKQYYLIPRN